MEQLWKKALVELELEVSKAVFHTMFKSTSLVSVVDNIATITTPSQIVSNLIEKRYYALLQKVLKRFLEKDVSIVFTSLSGGSTTKDADKNPLPLFHEDGKFDLNARIKKARLRMDFTFENFAVSESNQLAYAAATTVSKNSGTIYNPLFFYGTVGVGKTHLMQAIGHALLSRSPDKKVLYLTSEEFTNEFIESIRNKSTTSFRKKFRGADLFFLDDVQFLAGKEKVQEELFHTFNTLVSDEKQVVLSSDRPPQELDKIEKRLKSRFGGGLSIDIAPPDMELRCAILLIKARRKNFDLPIDVAKQIAERVEDTRRLEGALNRFVSELAHNGSLANTELLAKFFIGERFGAGNAEQKVSAEDVLTTVCTFYGIKPTQLKGPKRDRSLVTARHVLMFLLKTELGKTLVEIGNFLGGRDHTTVMHGVSKLEEGQTRFPQTHEDILRIKRVLWG